MRAGAPGGERWIGTPRETGVRGASIAVACAGSVVAVFVVAVLLLLFVFILLLCVCVGIIFECENTSTNATFMAIGRIDIIA
jgi:hypothetical protein